MNTLMRAEDRKSRKRMARKAEKLRLRAPGVMDAAKKQLARYCRLNSISDDECQRIADRINYEHSERNHLRKPVIARVREKRAAEADAEFARLQAKAAEEAEWVDVPQGSILKDGDEKNVDLTRYEGGGITGWQPIGTANVGKLLKNKYWQVRRRITP